MLKKNVLLIFCIIISNISIAQINAITDTGKNVLLYNNGTWKYVNDSLNIKTKIVQNDKLFRKDNGSTFLVKSTKLNIGVWINPTEWVFSKSSPQKPSEYKFKSKSKDVYGMLISERIQIPVESLVDIAYQNAFSAAPDIKILKKEYRKVNGVQVIMMQMKGTIQGIKFIYFGYYFSNKEGSIQLLTYTTQNLFETYKPMMENLLNGLVVLK